MKEWKKNLLLTGFSIVFALLLGEGVVRLVAEKSPESVFVEDPIVIQRAQPGGGLDAWGFFNAVVPKEAQVIALGDSMTQGYGVSQSETWPFVLSELASTSVYQMAHSASGPLQYLYNLTSKGLSLQPEKVVVGLYLGNDLYDTYNLAYHYDWWAFVRDQNFVPNEAPLTDSQIRTEVLAGAERNTLSYKIFALRLWVRDHVKLYALLGNATRQLRERFGLAHNEQEKLERVKELSKDNPDIAYVYDSDPRITTTLSPSYRADAVDLTNQNTKEGMRITLWALGAMHASSTASGAELMVAIIPTKEAVYLELMRQTDGGIPPQFADYEAMEAEVTHALLEFCKTEQIRCYNMRDDLVAELKNGRPIYKTAMDGHPPALGYRAYAESINRNFFNQQYK